MEYFRIQKSDGNIISCVKAIPDHPKGIVLAIHGFTSSKESSTYRLLLNRLPIAGYGMVGIDLPGDHVEAGGFAGTVRPQEAHNLSLLHFHGNTFHDGTDPVFLDKFLCA